MNNISTQDIHSILHRSFCEGHQVRLRVIGKSMLPLIQKGDWLVVESVTDSEMLKKGDIILFSRGREFVVHRIVELQDKEIITQGDWSRIRDLPISNRDVIGKVIEVEKPNLKIKLNDPFFKLINLLIYQIIKNIKPPNLNKRRRM